MSISNVYVKTFLSRLSIFTANIHIHVRNRKFPGTEVDVNASSEDGMKEKPSNTRSHCSTNKVDVISDASEKGYVTPFQNAVDDSKV